MSHDIGSCNITFMLLFNFLGDAIATSVVIYISNLCFSLLQVCSNYESMRPTLQLSGTSKTICSLTSPARLSFVLKVPLSCLSPSIIYSVPCDLIVQRAKFWLVVWLDVRSNIVCPHRSRGSSVAMQQNKTRRRAGDGILCQGRKRRGEEITESHMKDFLFKTILSHFFNIRLCCSDWLFFLCHVLGVLLRAECVQGIPV